MGFLKNVFSSKQKEEEIEIRAAHKDYKYFESELERIKLWSLDDKKGDEAFLQANKQLTPFHYSSSYDLQEKKIEILYSMHSDINIIRNEFIEAFPNFLMGYKDTPSYLSFLNVISFCVLLNMDLKYFTDISDLIYNTSIKKESLFTDSLLIFLLNSKVEKIDPSDNVFLPNKTSLLSKAIISTPIEAEEKINIYIYTKLVFST